MQKAKDVANTKLEMSAIELAKRGTKRGAGEIEDQPDDEVSAAQRRSTAAARCEQLRKEASSAPFDATSMLKESSADMKLYF